MISLSSGDRFCSELETEFLCTVYVNIGLQKVKSFICGRIMLHVTFFITFHDTDFFFAYSEKLCLYCNYREIRQVTNIIRKIGLCIRTRTFCIIIIIIIIYHNSS